MRDEQHQHLNYTTRSEAKQRPRSLPRKNRRNVISQPFAPSKDLPFCWGARQQSKEDIVLFKPIPGSAAQQQRGNVGREHRARSVWRVAWGIQPEAAQLLLEEAPSHPLTYSASLVSQIARWYSEGCSSIKETSLHPQVRLLTSIDSTWQWTAKIRHRLGDEFI